MTSPDRTHTRAKRLTAVHVVAIRELRAAGWTLKRLAALYGVSHVTIHNVCSRHHWKHVP